MMHQPVLPGGAGPKGSRGAAPHLGKLMHMRAYCATHFAVGAGAITRGIAVSWENTFDPDARG